MQKLEIIVLAIKIFTLYSKVEKRNACEVICEYNVTSY